MEKRKQQPLPPLSPPKRLYTVLPPPLPPHPPLHLLPPQLQPPLPNYCCGNHEKFNQLKKNLKIENFSQWKAALQQLLLLQNIDERIININLCWYKIKSSVASFHSLKETLENERPTLHYILIQGYNRHHLFTQEELTDKIIVIFKKKKEKRSLLYVIEECCIRSNKYGKSIVGHMQPNINQLLFLEILSKTRNPCIFLGILDTLESSYINHTCNM